MPAHDVTCRLCSAHDVTCRLCPVPDVTSRLYQHMTSLAGCAPHMTSRAGCALHLTSLAGCAPHLTSLAGCARTWRHLLINDALFHPPWGCPLSGMSVNILICIGWTTRYSLNSKATDESVTLYTSGCLLLTFRTHFVFFCNQSLNKINTKIVELKFTIECSPIRQEVL